MPPLTYTPWAGPDSVWQPPKRTRGSSNSPRRDSTIRQALSAPRARLTASARVQGTVKLCDAAVDVADAAQTQEEHVCRSSLDAGFSRRRPLAWAPPLSASVSPAAPTLAQPAPAAPVQPSLPDSALPS